jgi:hypothetical protein
VGYSNGKVALFINDAVKEFGTGLFPGGPVWRLEDDDLLQRHGNQPGSMRATPFVHDFDGDGDLDVMVGHEDGSVAYYQNVNTAPTTDPLTGVKSYAKVQADSFVLRSSDVFDTNIREEKARSSNAALWCGPLDSDVVTECLVGSETGSWTYDSVLPDPTSAPSSTSSPSPVPTPRPTPKPTLKPTFHPTTAFFKAGGSGLNPSSSNGGNVDNGGGGVLAASASLIGGLFAGVFVLCALAAGCCFAAHRKKKSDQLASSFVNIYCFCCNINDGGRGGDSGGDGDDIEDCPMEAVAVGIGDLETAGYYVEMCAKPDRRPTIDSAQQEEEHQQQKQGQQHVRHIVAEAHQQQQQQPCQLQQLEAEEESHQQERRRRSQRENEAYYKALSDASGIIDHFIRTRRKFNTSEPLEYACQFQTIENECGKDIAELLGPEDVPHIDNRRCLPLTVRAVVEFHSDLTSSHHRFSVVGSSAKVSHLTPLWGISAEHRVYGLFECKGVVGGSVCGRRWESAASWKDKWQKCQGCEAAVYPHEQHERERREKAGDDPTEEQDNRRPHDMGRCQKCRELGGICVPSMYYSA